MVVVVVVVVMPLTATRSLKFLVGIPVNVENFPKLSHFFWILIVLYYVKSVILSFITGSIARSA